MIDQASKLRSLIEAKRGVSPKAPGAPVVEHASLPNRCTTIAVTSGKGGVGKSNLSLMLAIALANLHKRVLLLDADLGLANVHILLGIAPKASIADLLNNDTEAGSVLVEGPGGIDILPGASGLESLANIEPLRLEILQRKLSALEERYDYCIIDTGAGIGRTVTAFCESADATILILTPEPTSLADAYAMVKVLYEKRSNPISVLVNMAASDAEGNEVFDKLNTLVVRFLKRPVVLLDIVPNDPEIPHMVRRQHVLLIDHPRRTASVRIGNTARRLGGMPVSAKKEGFFTRFFRGSVRD